MNQSTGTSLTPEQMRALADLAVTDHLRQVVEIQSALRAAAEQLEAVREALDESLPPYNSELRPDGSEDPIMTAYVDGVRDVYLPLDAILTADTAPQEDRDE